MTQFKIFLFILIILVKSQVLADLRDKSLEEVEANAARSRDVVHNLDLNNPEELRISNAYLYDFIKDNEEFYPYAQAIYDYEIIDKQPTKILKKRLIGYGFDMNRP